MLQILFFTFISLATQQTTKFNFSQFDDQMKFKQIYYLTRFIELEKSLNLTKQQAEQNGDFALELWINTENVLNQTTQNQHSESILDIINNQQFQNIIPQNQEGLQATQSYIEQWQNQTDDDKSVILQSVIQNVNQMIYSDDPENYNQTQLIESISNQTFILDENQKNRNTSSYISPLTWQHANVSKEEMILANFFYNTKSKNSTVQEEYNNLTKQDADELVSAFEKFFVNNVKNTNTTTNTINSKGEKPTGKSEELPFPQSNNNNNEDPIYMYLVFALMFVLLIAILFLLRRYLIQQKLIIFQMNEESNIQGFQA